MPLIDLQLTLQNSIVYFGEFWWLAHDFIVDGYSFAVDEAIHLTSNHFIIFEVGLVFDA